MNLDSQESIKALDSMKVGESLANFPLQIKEGWEKALSSEIPDFSPSAVVVSGMGGSSNAAKIIESFIEEETKIPFVVLNDYKLPGWVGKNTLVVGNTYSGNTEETVSVVEEAIKRGSYVLAVTTGGKLGDLIKEGKISGSIISPTTNPTGFPKSGLGVSLGALWGTLTKAGITSIKQKDLEEALAEVTLLRDSWLPEVKVDSNEAKLLANWLHGSIPVLFGGRPFLGSMQAGRNAMDEISRNFSLWFDFPEVNHVLIEATQKPDIAKNSLKYLFFDSNFNHERVRLRYQITQEIFEEQGIAFKTLKVWGKTALAQTLAIPHFCSWVGYYISMLDGSDPGPEPWIIKLKEKLSQPVH